MFRFSKNLRQFPWATYGRPESCADLEEKIEDQKRTVRLLSYRPKITVVLPVHQGISITQLAQGLASLQAQSYSDFELLLVANHKPRTLHRFFSSQSDPRFHWVNAEGHTGTAALKNEAALQSDGEWIVFMEAGSVLAPSALYEYVRAIQAKKVDLLYAHEVEVDAFGKKAIRFLSKPTFSWFDLVHFNYVGCNFAVSRAAFERVGGFDTKAEPHAEHDLLLRLHESKFTFHGISSFLYYHRPRGKFAIARLPRLIQNHLDRMQFPAVVESAKLKTIVVRPRLETSKSHLISVIICFKNKAKWTARCLQNLAQQIGSVPVEVILVNNQSRPEEFALIQKETERYKFPIKLVDYPHRFNFAAMHNWAIEHHCKGDYLFLLNNDVFFDGKYALDDFAKWLQFDWVGTVGCRLHFPDGKLQYGGMEASYGGFNRLVRIRHITDNANFTHHNKEIFAGTFAACAFSRSTFDAAGGLDPFDFYNNFGDVAFNFECVRQGKKNLYLGHVQAEHLESATQGVRFNYWNECRLEEEYPEILQQMIRSDLGYNRLPRLPLSIKSLLGSGLGATLAENLPWLNPVKNTLKRSRLFGRLLHNH